VAAPGYGSFCHDSALQLLGTSAGAD
jgi:hypothetical protein